MLKEIGVKSFEDLIQSIPESIRNPKLNLSAALSEPELLKQIRELGKQNVSVSDIVSFLGAGAYEHFIPAVVRYVTSRTEFYTAYTPYQAEASQGTLQSIYEYQSMMCRLTGMDVSTASHYDAATALAEAVVMSAGIKRKKKIVVAQSIHPHYREVLNTYLCGTDLNAVYVPFLKDGMIDATALKKEVDADAAAVVVQTPTFFGVLENVKDVETIAHSAGAHFIVAGNPLAYAGLKTPGEMKADIAVGDAQVFGNSLSFGGPYLGYIAATKEFMRKLPGRLVGAALDADGRRSFTLTLQAREQHIRRERATSNICSNQALCALAACSYLTVTGKKGLDQVWNLNISAAHYLEKEILKINGCEKVFNAPFFNEFVIRIQADADSFRKNMLAKGFDPGLSLGVFFEDMSDCILMCATETKTVDDIDRFCAAIKEVLG